MQLDWNEAVSVLWLPKGSQPPQVQDFAQSKNAQSAVLWSHAVEAIGCLWGELLFGRDDDPWICVKESGKIYGPTDIKGSWKDWRTHVFNNGVYGHGTGY